MYYRTSSSTQITPQTKAGVELQTTQYNTQNNMEFKENTLMKCDHLGVKIEKNDFVQFLTFFLDSCQNHQKSD